MALLINIELESGITISQAYARIDTYSGYNKGNVEIAVNYYVDQQASDLKKPYIKRELYSLTPDETDAAPFIIKQGYEYLKTLPQFANAVDA